MADTVTARQGDTLDALIWRTRALDASALGAVLAVNPGLAEQGAVLSAGTVVTIPAAPPTNVVRDVIQLWD